MKSFFIDDKKSRVRLLEKEYKIQSINKKDGTVILFEPNTSTGRNNLETLQMDILHLGEEMIQHELKDESRHKLNLLIIIVGSFGWAGLLVSTKGVWTTASLLFGFICLGITAYLRYKQKKQITEHFGS